MSFIFEFVTPLKEPASFSQSNKKLHGFFQLKPAQSSLKESLKFFLCKVGTEWPIDALLT